MESRDVAPLALAAGALVFAAGSPPAVAGEVGPPRRIEQTLTVEAPVAEVWQAWTTPAGAATFFAPRARIELALDGPFELLFDPEAKPGEQGSEGCKVLSFLPGRMLSFTWNAPTDFPEVRRVPTFVVVELTPQGPARTQVTLTHLGWRSGGQWDQVFAYFERAWGIVLGRLQHRFAHGPLDWDHPFTPPPPAASASAPAPAPAPAK